MEVYRGRPKFSNIRKRAQNTNEFILDYPIGCGVDYEVTLTSPDLDNYTCRITPSKKKQANC